MKWIFLIITLYLFTSGCDYKRRDQQLQEKEAALNQKEQELLVKEKTLQLKEQELNQREQHLDSTVTDTTHVFNQALVGLWSVKMTCSETTCSGSAVGDIKTEQWQISYTSNTIIAKAISNDQLTRVYTGFDTGNTIELVENRDTALSNADVKMIVRLHITDPTHLEGQREITRDNCKVVYDLKLEKANG